MCARVYFFSGLSSKNLKLFMVGDIRHGRDGTVLTCLTGQQMEDRTWRDSNIVKIIVGWMGRDETLDEKSPDVTGR